MSELGKIEPKDVDVTIRNLFPPFDKDNRKDATKNFVKQLLEQQTE